MKYIKKPFLVEAIQFDDKPETLIAIQELLGDVEIVVNYNNPNHPYLQIPFGFPKENYVCAVGAWVVKEEWQNRITFSVCPEKEFGEEYLAADNVEFTVDLKYKKD